MGNAATPATLKREVIPPSTKESWLKARAQDITSTECAAMFGLSPYLTPFELWHRKKSQSLVEMEPNERMKWGTRLQDSIANGIAQDNNWVVQPRPNYERLPELKLGASFDYTILCTAQLGEVCSGTREPAGLLEIKNVDSLALKNDWVFEGEDLEAPAHIEMQVQHQLLVSGLSYAYIGALVGGNHAVLIYREPAPKVLQSIVRRAEDFWYSIRENREPKPNFAKDAAFITSLYQEVRPGRVITEAERDSELVALVAAYDTATAVKARADETREEMKARILMKIGDAEKVVGADFTISAGTVKGSRVEAYDKAPYRNFRVTSKKQK